jgi:hypothetical protein
MKRVEVNTEQRHEAGIGEPGSSKMGKTSRTVPGP